MAFTTPGTSPNYINSNSGLPSSTSAFTVLMDVSLISDLNAITGILTLAEYAGPNAHALQTTADGTSLVIQANYGAATSATVATLVVGTGQWIAFRCNGGDLIGSVHAEGSGSWSSVTVTPTATFTPTQMFLGESDSSQPSNAKISHFRMWNAYLDDTALDAEIASSTVVQTTNLLAAKRGVAASLAAALTGEFGPTYTTVGTIGLDSSEPSFTPASPSETLVTVDSTITVDPLITIATTTVDGSTVSLSGAYSSVDTTPTFSAVLKSGATTVDTQTPTAADNAWSVDFTSVAAGTYTVEVTIDDSTTTGVTATSASFDVASAKPDAATGLSISVDSTTQLTATWTDNATTEDGYTVTITPSGGSTTTTNIAANSTSHAFTGLTPATAYTITVTPYNASGSPTAVSGSATTLAESIAGTSLTAQVLSDQAVVLTWTAVAGATEYRAFRKTASGGARFDFYAGTDLTYTLSGLSPATAYWFDVSTTDGTNTTFSNEVKVTTLATPTSVRVITFVDVATVDTDTPVEVRVQIVNNNGDPLAGDTVTLNVSGVTYTGTTTATPDIAGKATFTITPTAAGSLSFSATSRGVDSDTKAVEVVVPGTLDAATAAAKLAAAEKKSMQQSQKLSAQPLEQSVAPLELIYPEATASPLAALLNSMLSGPVQAPPPISLSEYIPQQPQPMPAQQPPPDPTAQAVQALQQVAAQQLQALNQDLAQLRQLIQ